MKTTTKRYNIPAPFYRISVFIIPTNLPSLCNCYSFFCWAFRISAVTESASVLIHFGRFLSIKAVSGISVGAAAWLPSRQLFGLQETWTNDAAGLLIVLFLCLRRRCSLRGILAPSAFSEGDLRGKADTPSSLCVCVLWQDVSDGGSLQGFLCTGAVAVIVWHCSDLTVGNISILLTYFSTESWYS